MGGIRIADDEWRPLCECHGERMHKATRGKFACAVIGRAKGKERYHRDPKAMRKKLDDWRKANPDREKAKRFRVPLETYRLMVSRQEERCAICGNGVRDQRGFRTLCIDHNHANGNLRGLLCRHCNTAIGLLGDDVERLAHAVEYVRSDGADLRAALAERGLSERE